MAEEHVNVVVVGCGLAGKTSLILRLTKGEFPSAWTPTIYEDYNIEVTRGSTVYKLTVWDINGDDDYANIRKIFFHNVTKVDVFLVCFALDNPTTYHNLIHGLFPELMETQSHTPLILIGTKTDLEAKITLEERKWIRQHINPNFYLECSALKGTGVKAVLEAVLEAHRNNLKHEKRKGCRLM